MGLSLLFVLAGIFVAMFPINIFLVLFDQRTIAFWVFGIDFPNIEGWLEVSLCLYISGLLYHFVPRI